MSTLPSHTRVVIIGGGAAGASTLFHLARMGWTDCILLEANELTAGSTWHAAGNCPNFSGNWTMMKLQQYSTQLYRTLGAEIDYPINYHVTGALRLAQSKDRMEEFKHIASMAESLGLSFELQTPEQLRERVPLMETHALEGGLWDAQDGDIDPAQLTQAYAKGARDLGCKIERFCKVTAIDKTPAGEWQLTTDKGTITTEIVINAAGYYAPVVGRMVGREIPSVTLSHQYLITEAIPALAEMDTKIPLIRDPDDSYYLRQERDGLILGPYEARPELAWQGDGPEDFSFQLLPDALDRLEWYIEQACARVPVLGEAGIQKVINGPVPYTPDGNPLIGPAPGLHNFFEICCFSFGITQSGGAGKSLAEWVVEGEPEWDLWSLDPRRYTDFASRSFVEAKALELYEHEYAIHFPAEERPAGRPCKTSPVYDRLKEKGAMFGARGGWERATWFPRDVERARGEDKEMLSFHHTNWFEAVAEECKAISQSVGILDLSGFGRFMVSGDGAADWLSSRITGGLPKIGRVGLAYFCSEAGTVVTEMTVTRFDENRFWLVGAAAAMWHDLDWLEKDLPAGTQIKIENQTDAFGTLVLTGPRSRDVLSHVTDCDLSNTAFPWLSHRPIEVAGVTGTALRVSFVGELGWELHMPLNALLTVYDALWKAGEAHGIRDFGMYAMESMRIEKCYRGWKQDLSSDYSPLTSGLDRFVKLDKPAFVGRDALLREKQQGSAERFVPLLLDDGDVEALYCSAIWQNGERVGLVTSGGYGHRIGRSIALGYVRRDLAFDGTELEVEILGSRRKAVVASEPLFDPQNERLRA